MLSILAYALLAILAGAVVYCLLTILAAWRYRTAAVPDYETLIPISILKPLAGPDDGLEDNLRSFFEQDYQRFEILFAVREEKDPAVPVVRKLRRQYGHVPTRLLVTGEPPYPNGKVHKLHKMIQAADYDLLVMSDSDIRVTPQMLRTVAAEFQDTHIGVATCPYRAVAGNSFWSRLEATGMNTDFLAGILVARLLEGMRFAVGPTIVARKWALERIGGVEKLKDYLAEDFVMGKFAAEKGIGVILSSYVIEHRIGAAGFWKSAGHRMRWVRSTRRSRPAGYIGQLFTMPLPIALLLCAVQPVWWPALLVAAALRAAAAQVVANSILQARLSWWRVPIEDCIGFLFWIFGFFGNTITWRGRRYHLLRDGTFRPVQSFRDGRT